jgi:hypothetical protein
MKISFFYALFSFFLFPQKIWADECSLKYQERLSPFSLELQEGQQPATYEYDGKEIVLTFNQNGFADKFFDNESLALKDLEDTDLQRIHLSQRTCSQSPISRIFPQAPEEITKDIDPNNMVLNHHHLVIERLEGADLLLKFISPKNKFPSYIVNFSKIDQLTSLGMNNTNIENTQLFKIFDANQDMLILCHTIVGKACFKIHTNIKKMEMIQGYLAFYSFSHVNSLDIPSSFQITKNPYNITIADEKGEILFSPIENKEEEVITLSPPAWALNQSYNQMRQPLIPIHCIKSPSYFDKRLTSHIQLSPTQLIIDPQDKTIDKCLSPMSFKQAPILVESLQEQNKPLPQEASTKIKEKIFSQNLHSISHFCKNIEASSPEQIEKMATDLKLLFSYDNLTFTDLQLKNILRLLQNGDVFAHLPSQALSFLAKILELSSYQDFALELIYTLGNLRQSHPYQVEVFFKYYPSLADSLLSYVVKHALKISSGSKFIIPPEKKELLECQKESFYQKQLSSYDFFFLHRNLDIFDLPGFSHYPFEKINDFAIRTAIDQMILLDSKSLILEDADKARAIIQGLIFVFGNRLPKSLKDQSNDLVISAADEKNQKIITFSPYPFYGAAKMEHSFYLRFVSEPFNYPPYSQVRDIYEMEQTLHLITPRGDSKKRRLHMTFEKGNLRFHKNINPQSIWADQKMISLWLISPNFLSEEYGIKDVYFNSIRNMKNHLKKDHFRCFNYRSNIQLMPEITKLLSNTSPFGSGGAIDLIHISGHAGSPYILEFYPQGNIERCVKRHEDGRQEVIFFVYSAKEQIPKDPTQYVGLAPYQLKKIRNKKQQLILLENRCSGKMQAEIKTKQLGPIAFGFGPENNLYSFTSNSPFTCVYQAISQCQNENTCHQAYLANIANQCAQRKEYFFYPEQNTNEEKELFSSYFFGPWKKNSPIKKSGREEELSPLPLFD